MLRLLSVCLSACLGGLLSGGPSPGHLFLTRLPFRALFNLHSTRSDGYSIEELCPVTGTVKPEIRGKAKHLLRGSIFGSSTQKVPANRYVNNGYAIAIEAPSSTSGPNGPITDSSADDAQKSDSSSENCMWPNALQVSADKARDRPFRTGQQFKGLRWQVEVVYKKR